MVALNVTHYPLDEIRTDGGTQARAALNEETVAEYAEALAAGETLPPIKAFREGKDYWLADGFHRLAAYRKASHTHVPADVKQGTRRDALLFAVGANAEHGLPRTNADKRRAVELLLRDEEWSKKSDSWISDACRVSDKTVAAVRTDLGIPRLTTVESKDGKVRPAGKSKPLARGKHEPEAVVVVAPYVGPLIGPKPTYHAAVDPADDAKPDDAIMAAEPCGNGDETDETDEDEDCDDEDEDDDDKAEFLDLVRSQIREWFDDWYGVSDDPPTELILCITDALTLESKKDEKYRQAVSK